MAEYADLYAARLTTPAEAVALIPSGAKVAMGIAVSAPPALLAALADRAEAGEVGDINLYYMLAMGVPGETVLRYELGDRIRPYSLFHNALERKLEARAIEEGRPSAVRFVPSAFGQIPRLLCQEIGVDTLLTTVSPMDEDGYFTFGTNPDYAQPVSKTAQRIIVEVNPHMPRVFGENNRLHISEVTALVEQATPLPQSGAVGYEPQDIAIGEIIAGLIEDGSTLQMGIGALPNAVCAALKGHRDLGVHTEMLTPGVVELMKAGVVNGARKTLLPGKSLYAFAFGDQSLYEHIADNPAVEGHPVSYVNDPAVIASNDRMISVNATLQIDLNGACNSEFLKGRQFTGSGGQLDFVRGASASNGGKSIIACHSTAAGGKVSRITTRLDGPVTTPRNDVQYVVTEHGWANLKGLSLDERARALIGLAHPQFRDELEQSARESGLI